MAEPLLPPDFRGELDDLSVELERVGDLADGVGRALSRGLSGAVRDGRSLKSVLGDIARSFADIALKAAFKPVGELAAGLVGNLFAATNPALQGVRPFAKGGVLARPSYFPLGNGNGIGLAGEAGPEAILPLARGSDGRLGVAGGGGANVHVTFNVTASDALRILMR